MMFTALDEEMIQRAVCVPRADIFFHDSEVKPTRRGFVVINFPSGSTEEDKRTLVHTWECKLRRKYATVTLFTVEFGSVTFFVETYPAGTGVSAIEESGQ